MAKKKAKKSVKKTVKPARRAGGKTTKKATKKAAKKKVIKKAAKKAPAPKASKKPAAAKAQKSTTISPYLTFSGNCEEAFNFYRSVFGGNFGYIGRFKEMPPMEGQTMPPEEGEKIMHISLPISTETMLMGSDSSEAFGHANIVGNNFSISITTFSQAEADRLYNGLSAGGKTTMPMNKTFWGSYFGMLVDKYGIQWMVSFDEGQKKKD